MEGYSHIELSEDEMDEAILEAKKKKEIILENKKVIEIEANNRKFLTQSQWSYDQTISYANYKAAQIFNGKFLLDENNKIIFRLLGLYFSNDKDFYGLAGAMNIENPSLDKGILLAGSIGTGKTWMMKIFSKNQKQVFAIQTAKVISELFGKDGEEGMHQFTICPQLPANDATNFFHSKLGLCVDDLGTEEIKIHFGNRKNVVGDLIELRYSNKNTGITFHATTNLTGAQLKEFYGDRVTSRLRETMNIIELKGVDRRK